MVKGFTGCLCRRACGSWLKPIGLVQSVATWNIGAGTIFWLGEQKLNEFSVLEAKSGEKQ